jgi:heme-degrading monooxygenase HmoA
LSFPAALGKNFLQSAADSLAPEGAPGFLQDFVLEQSSGPGEFNFVTIVEWESQEAVENARAAVAKLHREMNFNAQEMFVRLSIETDLAYYKRLGA